MIPSFAIPNYFIEEIISNGLYPIIYNYCGLSHKILIGDKNLNKRLQEICIENSLRGKECILIIPKQKEIIELKANPEFFTDNKLTIDNMEIYVRNTKAKSTYKKVAVRCINRVMYFKICLKAKCKNDYCKTLN